MVALAGSPTKAAISAIKEPVFMPPIMTSGQAGHRGNTSMAIEASATMLPRCRQGIDLNQVSACPYYDQFPAA
jgi:hypothetical protein